MRPAQDERYALYGIHRDRNCVSAAGLNGKIRIGKDRSGDLRGVIGAARRRMDDQLARIGAHQAPLQLVESNNNRLRKALVGLHPRDVELLMMRHVEQIGAAQIATVLGVSERKVKCSLLQALLRLRRLMESPP
jgi:DNA-directed RNA polymerase specialized sigma24 family protein